MNARQIKVELLAAAESGIREYLSTMRGANTGLEVMPKCENNLIQLTARDSGGRRFFELRIKEAWS